MRNFFAAFFGTLAALSMLAVAAVISATVLLSGISLDQEVTTTVPSGAWLVLDLSDRIQDAPLDTDGFEELGALFGEEEQQTLQARQLTRALQAAAKDPDIAGLYLSGQSPNFENDTGFATLEEVRAAIQAFRSAGKPVKAWLSFAGVGEYYLASVADEIVLDPFGALLLPGLASEEMFLAGAFEKLGIGVQVTRVGRYKSAIEPFTRKDMSAESRAQLQKLLDDIWIEITKDVEEARRLEAGALQRSADSEGFVRADTALSAKLVDRVAYVDEIFDELRKATNTKGSTESFRQIAVADYARLVPGTNLVAKRHGTEGAGTPGGHEKLAIVYTEGAIVDGDGDEDGMVFGDRVARQLRRLRRDDTVRGIVLRVNSPGGSVSASEAIQREVRLIQKDKPVVVSMGSVAASGGYWISTYSDRIFAEPTTITGSIGVFGLLFNVQGLANEKLGLTFETVKTGRFADAGTISRPKTNEELAIIQKSVDWIYDQFLSKVAESRKLDRSAVGEIAQGRVWSGSEATKIGLVDEIGGLDAAIAWVADKANVGEEFTVVEYPQKRQFVQQLSEALGRKRREKVAAGAVGAFAERTLDGLAMLTEFNDPRGIYARLPFHLSLK